jgi:hypothetical protein
LRLDRVEQFGPGDEYDSGARRGEQPSAEAGIGFEIEPAAFDCPKSDRIGHQPRFKARFDHEQATDLPQHTQPLIP